jgi:archaellum biogenesis ATPase FlaH
LSWINYEQIQRKVQLLPEEEVTIDVADHLMWEGLSVISISSSYQHSKHPLLTEICQTRHNAGFDLIVADICRTKIGVEVKRILTMNSFQNALGQAIVYLHNGDVKSAIIFARRFHNERTYQKIRDIMSKINEPIIIRTLEAIGQHRTRQIW